jgi:hypothetical protein
MGRLGHPAMMLALLAVAGADANAQTAAPAPARLFDPIAAVLQHARCMNCHTITEFPRQRDAGIRHTPLVMRGADGHGSAALECTTCHQTSNSADGKVPGAPHWHLAPLSMGWEGLTKGRSARRSKIRRKTAIAGPCMMSSSI